MKQFKVLAIRIAMLLLTIAAVNGSIAAENIVTFLAQFIGGVAIVMSLLVLGSKTYIREIPARSSSARVALAALDIIIVLAFAALAWYWTASIYAAGSLFMAWVREAAAELRRREAS